MPEPQACLYTMLYAGRERHEEVLRELVTPVAREIGDAPELDSLFFARYNEPRWQVRFRVLGRPAWVNGTVRELVMRRLEPLSRRGVIEGLQFGEYQRELERYGGEEGMRLAERIFLHDTLACLDLIEAERDGELATSRREFSLVMTESVLDLMKLEGERRLAFYERGYRWAIDMKTWLEEDLRLLDARYRELRPGLEDLFSRDGGADPAARWGGERPADIARRCLVSIRPCLESVVEGRSAGRISQDLVDLAWSYTHMHCNRLGIDPAPESILRYFMHRFMRDRAGARA